MKNVLFRGPFLQDDGWGEASRRYLLSLVKCGHHIESNFLKLGNKLLDNLDNVDKSIIDSICSVEKDNYDIVIHYILPQLLSEIKTNSKNILFFHFETQTLMPAVIDKLSKMDMIFVSTIQEKNIILQYNLNNVEVIPCPVDYSEYKNLSSIEDDVYNFYTIGEFVARKNIINLIYSYFATFSSKDKVRLIIKSNILQSDFAKIELSIMQSARKSRNIADYPQIVYIDKKFTRKEILEFHNRCDCFVSISHGESVCLPLLDALMIGNKAIITAQTGMDDHIGIDNNNISTVNSNLSPCFINTPPLLDIYSCNDLWMSPNLYHFMNLLSAKNTEHNKTKYINQLIKDKHSPKSISKKLYRILNEI